MTDRRAVLEGPSSLFPIGEEVRDRPRRHFHRQGPLIHETGRQRNDPGVLEGHPHQVGNRWGTGPDGGLAQRNPERFAAETWFKEGYSGGSEGTLATLDVVSSSVCMQSSGRSSRRDMGNFNPLPSHPLQAGNGRAGQSSPRLPGASDSPGRIPGSVVVRRRDHPAGGHGLIIHRPPGPIAPGCWPSAAIQVRVRLVDRSLDRQAAWSSVSRQNR